MSLLDDKIELAKKRKSEIENLYYPELPSKKRIKRIIEDYISDVLTQNNFKFYKTRLAFEKLKDDFRYSIIFSPSKKNYKEVVDFRIYLSIESLKLKTWRLNHKDLTFRDNGGIFYEEHSNVKNWNIEYDETWYQLSIDDNLKIVNNILENIDKTALPLFEEFSNLDKIIDHELNRLEELRYRAIIDYYHLIDLIIVEKNLEAYERLKKLYFYWANTDEYLNKEKNEYATGFEKKMSFFEDEVA